MTESSEPRSNRRGFFRAALTRAVKPLANYIEDRIEPPRPRTTLRPPGAIAESALVSTCERHQACVDVCPAGAITLLGRGAGAAAGTPIVDPDRGPCVLCEGLQCTQVCPSGALLPLCDLHDVRMGTAEVYRPLCVRSDGEECTKCVTLCPIRDVAIKFEDTGPPVVLAGCVGCGICQHHCPTTPKAIMVIPL